MAQHLRNSLDDELEPLRLTGQQAALLLRCEAADGESFDALAKSLGTDSAGVTRLADRLEDKGLLLRQASPHDRRATRLALTAKGRSLSPAVWRSFKRWKHRALKGLAEKDLAQAEEILDRILANHEPAEKVQE